MTSAEHETEAVLVYRRTLGEVADNRVVAAAEGVIADAWIHELERARRSALASTESEQNADPHRMCLVIEAVDAELERICIEAIDRTRRGRDDLSRLRTAWTDAYGTPVNPASP